MDPFKVRDLIDLGDFSSLRETVEETAEGAYNDDCPARRYMNLSEYLAECQQEEYDYILRQVEGEAVWFVRCYATDGAWVMLHEAKALQERMEEEGCY